MDIIDRIIKREGGYVDNPHDRGGCTNFGITIGILRAWRDRQVTCEDVRNLTRFEAREIYDARYIGGFARIQSVQLREHVVDAGVLHGPATAARWLQAVVGVKSDGIFGPISARATNQQSAEVVGRRFAAYRIRFLGRLISGDHSQARFAAGWLNRATHFLD